MTQEQAISILKTGVNVFLTGEPGSGKTHTVNEYVAYLRSRGVEPAITASTGIAATHIGGTTIHSWSGIEINTSLDAHDLRRIAANKKVAARVKRAKVLIVDEVSMLSPSVLSLVDLVCRHIKESPEPFGGIQVVFVGDFFQLPPVVRRTVSDDDQAELFSAPEARFAYDAPAWARANPTVCYLAEQHRQDDVEFLTLLSAIRRDEFTEEHLVHIEKRKIERGAAPDNVPKLFSHNLDVDLVNDRMLAKISGEAKSFAMSSQGPAKLVATLKRGCLSPETLRLKKGATVMFTKNSVSDGFANGTIGIVEAFDAEDGSPVVRTKEGRRIIVSPMDWMFEAHGAPRARITQFPLRLAWAITVHKSQGMSLDAAAMDLSSVFEFGQGYVALSRVRRLAGLYIFGWNEQAFRVHPDVLEKDDVFREASEDAEVRYENIPPAELQRAQDAFIAACGGKSAPL